MLVQLAHPRDGHEPDEVIEVDDAVGRDLVRDGLARRPDIEGRTVDQLRAMAAERHVDLGCATRKADIEAALRDAESSTNPAPAGSTEGVTAHGAG